MLLKITTSALVQTSKRYGVTAYEPFTFTHVVNWDCTEADIKHLMSIGSDDFQVLSVEPYEGNFLMRKFYSRRRVITEPWHKMFYRLRQM